MELNEFSLLRLVGKIKYKVKHFKNFAKQHNLPQANYCALFFSLIQVMLQFVLEGK